MMEQKINVHHADDHADLLVVQTALDFAKQNSTKRCTCRKSGLDCSVACGECRGACSNFSQSAIYRR